MSLKGSVEHLRVILVEICFDLLHKKAEKPQWALTFVTGFLDLFQSTPHCGALGGAIHLKLMASHLVNMLKFLCQFGVPTLYRKEVSRS